MSQMLLVDVGNQRIKCAQVVLDKLLVPSDLEKQISDRAIAIDGGDFNRFPENMPTPERILISSVSRTELNTDFERYCQNRWNCTPEIMRSPLAQLGLKNGYQTPSQLGVDRWLAALASYKLESVKNIIVIDAGTAITVDLIVSSVFKGGSILPGFSTIVRTLSGDTGQIKIDPQLIRQTTLRQTEQNAPIDFEFIATTSADAVKAGALAAIIGGVNYCVTQIQATLKTPAKILITGGDANLLAPSLGFPDDPKSNLVLLGLGFIAQEMAV